VDGAVTIKPVTITPKGVPQPADALVSLPPVVKPADPLQDAAARLLQWIRVNGIQPNRKVVEVASFQKAYNTHAKPKTPLATDGVYGSKTQAALQAVITPEVAPSLLSAPSKVVDPVTPGPVEPPLVAPAPVVVPKEPAPSAIAASVDNIELAATKLIALPPKKGSFEPVRSFQLAWNAHTKNAPVISDGMYGPNTQLILQAYLNWEGKGRKAPANAYGKVTKSPPTYRP
jgi:hypothetical protein